jgi:hypothetical protein
MRGRRGVRIVALSIVLVASVLVASTAGTSVARAANWTAQTSPVTTPLLGVNCPDAADCWAVGGNTSGAKIVHTANGASASPTWSTQAPPAGASAPYNDVSCPSTSNC